MAIETVGVIGCGLMGSGITQVCAQSGYRTIVREASDELVSGGIGRIDGILSRNVSRGRMTDEEKAAVLGRITGTTELGDLAECDLVIEAVTENLETKQEVFRTLDGIAPAGAILASNTSSISITELAAATDRPEQVLGLHFFNPVPVMGLIEMVVGLQTSEETVETARQFGESLGKQVIQVKDTPGFIVNYLLIPYLLDAVRLVESGVASKEDIDAGMVLGCSHPLGPLKLLDFIGLDTTLYIAEVLHDAFRTDRYAAPPLLRQMVAAGMNGRKAGQGFYAYD
ncbi:MAG: 3-hydroxybutyryl-CoA dehydrogenase [Gemmatimonadetes bacterium]|nr:3-hydroxybutyryl-CoA dehydrogenase [Gemmatimonadota bacterium]MYG17711.1 3-hydroxybutyryl-CoA dehydrogenase [Gemmatimonadota bacterium]